MTATYQINYLGSLPKEDVYTDYLHLCEVSDKEPLSKAMLGKILHQYVILRLLCDDMKRWWPDVEG
jgi:hypothetical protein